MKLAKMEATTPEFRFSLCANCVRVLDSAVRQVAAVKGREAVAMAAGQRIRGGSRKRDDVFEIADWKSHRAARLIHNESNDDASIKKALDVAASGQQIPIVEKMDALVALFGVSVPMASAILTCIDPEFYTVIDVRALAALGVERKSISKDLYVRYLEFCRATAENLGVGLRQLDRALWKSGSIV